MQSFTKQIAYFRLYKQRDFFNKLGRIHSVEYIHKNVLLHFVASLLSARAV